MQKKQKRDSEINQRRNVSSVRAVLKVTFARPHGCISPVMPAGKNSSFVCGLTIGTFDGLHKAHKILIDTLKDELALTASEKGLPPYHALLSFYPHPRTVVGIKREDDVYPVDDYKKLLTPVRVRAARAREMGIDELRLLHFTSSLSKVSAREFLLKCIFEPFLPSLVVVGFDWSFGKGREGSTELLKEIAEEYNCRVVVVEKVTQGEKKIGARQIRLLLREGQVRDANELLGYPFMIYGKVVRGDGRGSLIGVPTANLKVARQFLPRSGVYRTYAEIDGVKYLSVTNVGVRPTFRPDAVEQVVETHIFDFKENLYGRRVRLEFIDWIRAEKKFSSVEALITQIHSDMDVARKS
jgi:riboflavin kinase / FMN adenylyltransferase